MDHIKHIICVERQEKMELVSVNNKIIFIIIRLRIGTEKTG